jgi:hypothetical protein
MGGLFNNKLKIKKIQLDNKKLVKNLSMLML